jgi:hypothetical protein
MLAERPKVEQAIQAVCGRAGMEIRRVPGEHAGGKWRLSYPSASGRSGMLPLLRNRHTEDLSASGIEEPESE